MSLGFFTLLISVGSGAIFVAQSFLSLDGLAQSSVALGGWDCSYLVLICLVFFLMFILDFLKFNWVDMVMYSLSLSSGMACFLVTKSLLFWVCYEGSMLPLLYLLYVQSGYSERYLAGWFLCGYLFMTGLPMLIVLVYISCMEGSVTMSEWDFSQNKMCYICLFMLFITKIPLPPFHNWLPIVHAEASTLVSILLSGFMMKLGIMGVYRFCFSVLLEKVWMVSLMFLFSLLFFIVSSFELDNKRWLAFLSLAHILIAVVGMLLLPGKSFVILFFYSLCHGLSAGALFYLFGDLYMMCGTRKWLLTGYYHGVGGVWQILLCVSLLSVASFPPSGSFLSEMAVFSESLTFASFGWAFCVYIFIGGLVPLWLFASLINNSLDFCQGGLYSSVLVAKMFGFIGLWLLIGLL